MPFFIFKITNPQYVDDGDEFFSEEENDENYANEEDEIEDEAEHSPTGSSGKKRKIRGAHNHYYYYHAHTSPPYHTVFLSLGSGVNTEVCLVCCAINDTSKVFFPTNACTDI